MQDKLRRRYQVQKEVTRNGYFEGEIALSKLERLGQLLHPGDGGHDDRKISVTFEFVRNEYDIPMIKGQLRTSLELECQRCLQSLDMPLELEFELMIDASDELLRDSSLLHEDSSCNEHWQASASEPEAAAKENPFAVLQQLKTTD
jgi:uncharacterized protein